MGTPGLGPASAARLLGQNGILKLHRAVGKATFRGKGHEQADLAKLMRIYSDWAHELFPRYTFRDFAAATERVAASKRMRVRSPASGGVVGLFSLLTAAAARQGCEGRRRRSSCTCSGGGPTPPTSPCCRTSSLPTPTWPTPTHRCR